MNGLFLLTSYVQGCQNLEILILPIISPTPSPLGAISSPFSPSQAQPLQSSTVTNTSPSLPSSKYNK